MREAILGISAYYHDSAAALLVDGKIMAAAQEERFTRIKHDASFPANAARYVMDEAGLTLNDLTAVAFYDKPWLKFERLLETYHLFAPKGLQSFLISIPIWIREKLFMRKMLNESIAELGGRVPHYYFPEHHLSHAASAFYPSPFEHAAILTIDGVGEWTVTMIAEGKGASITSHRQMNFPHSVGLLYSAFTYYTGFRVNSGEYKLMGLAPYGDAEAPQTKRFIQLILNELIDLRDDGSILLNMRYFDFATGLRMCNDRAFEKLFGLPRRSPESEITSAYMNLAYAIQFVCETIVLKLAKTAREITNCPNLVMAGGVALNCVANGHILKEKIFDKLWIQPAAGDAGGALGAAMAVWHLVLNKPREVSKPDSMQGSLLGPEFSSNDVMKTIRKHKADFHHYDDFEALCQEVAMRIARGEAIGWMQGRMEWGPRALGNRSILADARDPQTQKKLNLKIKYREGFRPFAPSVLTEDAQTYFEQEGRESPYMLLVAKVLEERCLHSKIAENDLYTRLYQPRSDIPAVTHLDYSARIQTVCADTNPRYAQLINAFKKRTGCGVIVNTSFNVRGEPIVRTPEDAYRCFMRTEMDCLVIGDFLFDKSEQPAFDEDDDWQKQYQLD